MSARTPDAATAVATPSTYTCTRPGDAVSGSIVQPVTRTEPGAPVAVSSAPIGGPPTVT
jgi:hypothetical protein